MRVYNPLSVRYKYVTFSKMYIGIQIGILVAAGVFAIFSSMPRADFIAWGWRVPFLLSVVVIGLGLYLRLHLKETPAFAEVKENVAKAKSPIAQIFRTRRTTKDFFLAFGSRIGENGGSYIFQTFVLSYLVLIHVASIIGLIGILITSVVSLFTLPFFGNLSDRIGRRPVFMGGAIFMLLFAFPYFLLLNTRSPFLIVIAIILSYAIGTMGMLAGELAFFSELFPTQARYAGVALARELSAPIAGGIAPFVAVALLLWAGWWAVAIYIMILALISAVSVFLAPETYKRDIKNIEAEEDSPVLQVQPNVDVG